MIAKAMFRLILIGSLPFIIMGSGISLSQYTGMDFISAMAWLCRIISIILGIFLLLRFFYLKIRTNPELKETHKNVLLSFYTFTIAILCMEFGLTFYSQSTLNPAAFSSINWFMANWKPINSDGFRDDELQAEEPIDLIFMGDSFTAGVGIKDYTKRFSNLVESQGNYSTYNMGRNGQNLRGVIDELSTLSLQPKYIFVQYYVNDIIQTGEELGYAYNPINYSSIESFFIFSSYLFNHYYTRKHNITEDEIGFLEQLEQLQAIPEVWMAHLKEIDEIIKLSEAHEAKLVFILFPFLPNPSMTEHQITAITNYIVSKGIETILVGSIIEEAQLKPAQCVVNKYDEHPSPLVHTLLAEEIIQYIQRQSP